MAKGNEYSLKQGFVGVGEVIVLGSRRCDCHRQYSKWGTRRWPSLLRKMCMCIAVGEFGTTGSSCWLTPTA